LARGAEAKPATASTQVLRDVMRPHGGPGSQLILGEAREKQLILGEAREKNEIPGDSVPRRKLIYRCKRSTPR